MRRAHWAVLAVLVLVAASVHADGLDPQIIIRGGTGGSIHMTSPNLVIDPEFEFNNPDPFSDCVPALVGPLSLQGWSCEVLNLTGMDITNLFISFGNLQPPLSCVSDPNNIFNNCFADPNGGFFVFSGGVIPNNTVFLIDFGGFAPGTNFAVHAPEPATLCLLLAGMAGVIAFRRRQTGDLSS